MGTEPVVIKYSEIINTINSLPMNELNDSRHITYRRTNNESDDKTRFLKSLLRTIHCDARIAIKTESKKLIREFENIFDSVAESLWERIKYENVNFFTNDVKVNVYETALNMFMKKYFSSYNMILKNDHQYNADSIIVKLIDTDNTIKVCNLNKLFENVYIPNKIYDTFIAFVRDCLPSVSYPDRFFLIIYEFYKYYEINRLIIDHMYEMISKKFKYHDEFKNILMRNDIFMKSFAIEYAKFSRKFMSSIAAINTKYPAFDKAVATEIRPILTNKDSCVGDLASCDFVRDMLNILTKAKSMNAPNLDPRCDTLCENIDELEKAFISTFDKMFELKEKVFEPLEYNEEAIERIYASTFFDNEVCPPEYESYKTIIKECISEVDDVHKSIVSELEAWCVEKIDDKVNYGYNYDSISDLRNYFISSQYVNNTKFVKFTNPVIFNLIYNFKS